MVKRTFQIPLQLVYIATRMVLFTMNVAYVVVITPLVLIVLAYQMELAGKVIVAV